MEVTERRQPMDMIDITADTVRDQIVELKKEITALYRELLPWAALAEQYNDLGGAASAFVTNKAAMETWAAVWEKWGNGKEVLDDQAPLDPGWWKALLEAKDPTTALDTALAEQLSKREIRRRFCKPRTNHRPQRVPFKLTEWKNGLVRGYAPLDTEPPDPLPEAILEIKG